MRFLNSLKFLKRQRQLCPWLGLRLSCASGKLHDVFFFLLCYAVFPYSDFTLSTQLGSVSEILNMTIRTARFNIILLLFLCGAFLSGCKTTDEKAKAKEAATLSFHLEVNNDGTPTSGPIPIYRAQPFLVNVQKQPFLETTYISKVEVVDTDDGFVMRVNFDLGGASRLDGYTTSYNGHRIAILATWTEARWLAAPRISRRLNEGMLVFTPDCTRQEAERIANGVNNLVKKFAKPFVF